SRWTVIRPRSHSMATATKGWRTKLRSAAILAAGMRARRPRSTVRWEAFGTNPYSAGPPMYSHRQTLLLGLMFLVPLTGRAADGNRLTYLDESDPYYVSRSFPRLVTPQWVGEDGVEAVIILAIDDMRDPDKYEKFLRPILQRLKRIDGRAPVSIMTNQVDPRDDRLQGWLKEGLSLETHTLDHPCPFFKGGDFAK